MKHRILITGLNGLVGWHIYQAAAKHHLAYGTYRKRHPALREDKHFFRVNWEDPDEIEAFFRKTEPEYLIHAWSMCDMDVCEISPKMAEKVNVEGTRKILVGAQRAVPLLKKFVFLSTAHVFDGEKGGYTEFDEPNPIHVFGRTKRKAELLVQRSGLPWMIVRTDIVAGASLQGDKGTPDFFIKRTKAGKPTHYFIDEWRTLVRGERLGKRVLELSLSEETGIFHIAGNRVMSRYEIAVDLVKQHGLPTKHIHPRLRKDDQWAHIRPRDLSLKTARNQRLEVERDRSLWGPVPNTPYKINIS